MYSTRFERVPLPLSGCTAAGLLHSGRRPAYAARVCKAVHTLAALLRRRSPAPIRSAYAARIRCSSPATAAMAKSRSRLSRCSFTDYAPYDRRRSTAGCAGANFHREVHQCEHWYSGSDAYWYCMSRASGEKVVCGSAHAAAREACTKYRAGHVDRTENTPLAPEKNTAPATSGVGCGLLRSTVWPLVRAGPRAAYAVPLKLPLVFTDYSTAHTGRAGQR